MGLFKPAWKSMNEGKAIKVVENLTIQRKLARAAKKPYWLKAGLAAVKILTDQNLLADVAKNGINCEVCKVAIKKLTNQNLLVDVAKNCKYSDVRITASLMITDEKLLLQLIQFFSDELKKSASGKIAEILMEIYRKREDDKTRNSIAENNGVRVVRRIYRDYTDFCKETGEDPDTCSSLSGMGGCNVSTIHYDNSIHDYIPKDYLFNTEES